MSQDTMDEKREGLEWVAKQVALKRDAIKEKVILSAQSGSERGEAMYSYAVSVLDDIHTTILEEIKKCN